MIFNLEKVSIVQYDNPHVSNPVATGIDSATQRIHTYQIGYSRTYIHRFGYISIHNNPHVRKIWEKAARSEAGDVHKFVKPQNYTIDQKAVVLVINRQVFFKK